ncbi:Mitogen-activated protein kinase kinase 2 [Cytospora mali]|uniref:Mitogen-activated protein kinase kinase 2 n=1 Tax=Cytospora mali TaxID=578113 RepID=A0A194V084_CYTMA|nr:Mitogen-activated protein kinase kinase 2 [Valsa mali var. pyri (nom. inval.)]
MSTRGHNTFTAASAEDGVRNASKPSNRGKDGRQQTSPDAAQHRSTSSPASGNAVRVVSFASGLHNGGFESSASDGDHSNDDHQSNGIHAAQTSYMTDSPTATENSPTGTFSVGNPLIDENQSVGSLKPDLNNALLESQYDKSKVYLPRNEIKRMIHPESIKTYWLAHTERQFHDECSDVIDYVCGVRSSDEARRVFAVLLFIEEPVLILDVIEDEVYDSDLPLICINKKGTDFQLARKTHKEHPIRCFNKWKKSQRVAFEKFQWQVTAPRFNKLPNIDPSLELPVTELDDQSILPLTEYDSKSKYQGNSEVVRVQIHSAHHDFDPEENRAFALKSLKSEDIVGFRLEAKALIKIRRKPHLVSVLAAFKYQNKYHLLFRWADGGNLAEFWSQTKPVANNYKSVCWLAEQCHGLVDGLDGIHNARLSVEEVGQIRASSPPSSPIEDGTSENVDLPGVNGDDQDCGRHGDIKPQNILWFKQDKNQYGRGVLKISDFGLTTFHSALTTKVPNNVPVTYTYAAPERDIDSDLSRPFDIWSLGCVYLQFITWSLLGDEQLSKFKEKRMESKDSRTKFETDEFYSVYRDKNDRAYATVKGSVTEWIKYLEELPACSRFLSDFLHYIQTKMMVVDKTHRDTCGQVRKSLKDMYDMCEKDRNYAISSGSRLSVLPTHNPSSDLSTIQELPTVSEGNDISVNGEKNVSITAGQQAIMDERNGESASKNESTKARMKQKLRYLCFY